MWSLVFATLALQSTGAPPPPPDSLAPDDAVEAQPVSASPSLELQVVESESVFAVITHKGGFAARLAHNHLITAAGYDASLTYDPEDPSATAFAMRLPVDALVVDDPDQRARWAGRLADLDVEDDLGTPDEGDRRSIRNTMLGEKQLDFARHPAIDVRLLRVTEGAEDVSGVVFPWVAEIEFTVRGVPVRRLAPVRYDWDGTTLSVEAVGRFTFEEFDIEPYSAALGSVKNQNEFHVYLNMKAVR